MDALPNTDDKSLSLIASERFLSYDTCAWPNVAGALEDILISDNDYNARAYTGKHPFRYLS
jgi:hypothetical protein